jgi:hypothetical protein
MKKQKAKRKPKQREALLIPIHIKLTKSERVALQKRANWFALGNLSAWLRYTGLRYVPKRGENVSRFIAGKKR